jgi:hypothetical protein
MQVVIVWNAHLRNEMLEDLDLSSEIVSQFDDVLSAIARMNMDIEGESRRTLTIMVCLRLLSPFLCTLFTPLRSLSLSNTSSGLRKLGPRWHIRSISSIC